MHLQKQYQDVLDQLSSMPTAESHGAEWYEDHGINRAACIYAIGADDAGRIAKAMLIINTDVSPSVTDICILQGALHVFGLRLVLPGSIVAIPSALKSMNTENHLTDLDLRLIRTLYSVQLRLGMRRSAVLRIVEDMANTDQ